jgi:CRP/FNR family transcriptional regulator
MTNTALVEELQQSSSVALGGERQSPPWLQEARGRGLLSRLPDNVVDAMVGSGRRVEYPPGTVALRWDEAPQAGIVLRGILRSFVSLPNGTQVTTRYLRPGDMTGVFAPRKPRLARGVEALEASELLFIDGRRVKELSFAMPQLAWELIEELTTSLNSSQKALYVRASGSIRQRVVVAIIDRAEAAGDLVAGLRVAGTQHQLANAVGSVREVVAGVLKSLKREGLVEIHRGGLVILEPDRLVDEANAGLGLSG